MYLQCTRLNWHGLKIFNLKNPRIIKRLKVIKIWHIRDQPFNLKGGGVMVFVSFRIFFSDSTKDRIIIFFVAPSAKFFSRI